MGEGEVKDKRIRARERVKRLGLFVGATGSAVLQKSR